MKRKEALAVGATVALLAVLLILKTAYDAYDPWHNEGRGPGWECTTYGRGAAKVCAKDVPQTDAYRRQSGQVAMPATP